MRMFWALAVSATCVLGWSAGARGQSFVRAGEEIVAVGDSMTEQGIYQRQMEGVFKTLYPEGKIRVVNLGKSGAFANWQIEPLKKYLSRNKAGVITAMFGVNDTKWNGNDLAGKSAGFAAAGEYGADHGGIGWES